MNLTPTFRVRVQDQDYQNTFEMAIVADDINGRRRALRAVEVVEVDDFAAYTTPTFRTTKENLQYMMDDLWRMGIRPRDYGEPQGAVGPQREHIADLRKVLDAFIATKT